MIVITIAFVSGIPAAYMPESLNAETSHAYHAQVSFISVVCRSSDSSIQAARLIAAYDLAPYCQRIASAFSPGHDSPSNDRFSPRARFALHGKQYFRNTATFGILPSPLHSMIHRLQTERRDSFRVRDSHPIPLFSEQVCVSDLPRGAESKLLPWRSRFGASGRACATKAMLFSLLYARLFYAHKKTSPALRSRRQKKSRILCIFGLIVRKNYLFI